MEKGLTLPSPQLKFLLCNWLLSGSGPGQIWPKNNNTCREHVYFIPTNVHQNPSSGSGEEVENGTSLRSTDDDGWTDGQTDGWTSDDAYGNTSVEPSAQVS